MDKSWMHSDRRSKAYELGVEAFLNFAVENLLITTHIYCPCVKLLSMPNREYNDVIGDEVLDDVIIECEPFTRGMPNVDTFDELAGELGGQNIRDGCEDIWIE
ncbi:hypothetical protein L3X38_037917 [Prunus dulcis]|uniref:Transposase-associated domain-containing protein n=1 Tax=Prunus dulcis TaxID=3755 RepID=A0AAD4V4B6_PRUDU|nr:hypothetical protein L3X38_037917 [Prunus dulcis]